MNNQPRKTWRTRCSTKDKVYSHGHCDKCNHQWKNHNRYGCKLFSCVCTNPNYPLRLVAKWYGGESSWLQGNRRRKRVI